MSARTTIVDSIKDDEFSETGLAGLPLKRGLTIPYVLSLMMVLITTAASVGGLLYPGVIYPTDDLRLSFLPSDVFNLVVGLPLLLASLWLARRGKLVGLLIWPGMLFYVLYAYVPYLIAVPLGVLFLPYLVIVALGAYSLIRVIASIDGQVVRQRLAAFTLPRISAVILICLAILILLRQGALILTALTTQAPVDTLELSTWIADFAVAIPALLVVGIQLWRRAPLGYATGAGLLLGYGLLALSLIPFFVLQAHYNTSPVDVAGIITILIMASLCLIPLAFFVRAASGQGTSPA